MFMRSAAICVAVCMSGSTASAALIDFEGLLNGDVVTNQFADVVFSSNAGSENKVTTQPGIGFGNNFLCTGPTGGSIDCANETILTFMSGVSNLSFYQVGDNNVGVVAMVDVFVNGVFDTAVSILGFDTFNTPDLVDLTGFANVTSIRIHSITDGGGLGWDNFSYDVAQVPVPASMALLLGGLAGLGAMRRSRARPDQTHS